MAASRTSFRPGFSGNPGGRPKGIEAIAREHTPAAIAAPVAALQNPRERVAAADYASGSERHANEWLLRQGFATGFVVKPIALPPIA